LTIASLTENAPMLGGLTAATGSEPALGGEARRAAIRAALADRGHRVEAFIALLHNPDPALLPEVLLMLEADIQPFFTVAVLGSMGDTRAVPALIDALRHSERCVRQCAAEALGFIGDAAAVPALLLALSGDSSDVREQAAKALGRIGTQAAVPMLTRCAATDYKRFVREAAKEALQRINAHHSKD
jgi:HEAT repeat protein